MVLRQTRLIALLLFATIVVLALASLAWFGPDAPFMTARDHGGGVRAALDTKTAAIAFTGYAAVFSLALDRAARIRRWRRNLIRAGGAFAMGWLGGLVLILATQIIAWAQALRHVVDRDAAFALVVAMIVLLKANLLPKSRPAWFNGTTLPLFAPDPLVWRRVHRASAVRLVAIALVIVALALAAPVTIDLRATVLRLLIAEVIAATLHGLWLSGVPRRRATGS